MKKIIFLIMMVLFTVSLVFGDNLTTIVLSDTTHDFGWVKEGNNQTWDVSILNDGSVDLVISDVLVNAPYSCVYPDTIIPGETGVATITLDATNPGIYTDETLTIVSNGVGTDNIDLNAIVYGSDYVLEGFEDTEFPPFGWFNDDGYWDRYTYNAYEGDGYARCSWAHISDACLVSPRLIVASGDFISFYWINANLYDGKSGGKVAGADTTYFEITNNYPNGTWEILAVLAPEEEMTEYEHVVIQIPDTYVGNTARIRWRHTTELSAESRGAGVDEVMSPPLYLPVNFNVDPLTQSDYDAAGTTVQYDIDVYNTGVQTDRYFLSIIDSSYNRDLLLQEGFATNVKTDSWPTYLSDPFIDVNPGEYGSFIVSVEIPEDVNEDEDNITKVYIESRENSNINRTAEIKTVCHPKDPYEPNNTFADATPIDYGFVSDEAQIYYNPDYYDKDIDIYKFDGSEGDIAKITFDITDSLLFDGAIALLDADSTILATADNYAGGVSEILQYRLQNDGTFYYKLGVWYNVIPGPYKKTLLKSETKTYYTATLELIPSPDILVEPQELTIGIVNNGKTTASDTLYITNTGPEGAINLDWDIEIVIPGIDIFLDEGFDNFPPDGWTADYHWSGSNTINAGGTVPEAKFSWFPSYVTSRLISPVINTLGYTSLPLNFKHFVDDYSGGYTVGVATTSDGGVTWNDVWTVIPTGNIGPETVSITLDNSDVGSETFQLCWYFSGVAYDIDYWYIDDVYMSTVVWATANPVSGSVPQGATQTTTITCNDTTLTNGVYTADIIVHNNAELYGASDVYIPLTLYVMPLSGGLQGTVTCITTGEPIDSVKVSLGNFVTYTDLLGFFSFDNIPQGIYSICFEKPGFRKIQLYDIILGTWIVVLNVQMTPILPIFPPPTNFEAEGNILCVDLSWSPPSTGGVTQVDYILDDGTYENGWAGNPGYELWFGNLFPVDDTGELISFDLYSEFNSSAGTDLLEIDIFDAVHNLVGSSESFVPTPDTWTTITAPNIPFDGEFYAMIHYNYETAQSHWMGFDENGQNANAGLDWYTDGSTWSLFHVEAGATPGVFMLRATAMVQGELCEMTTGNINYTLDKSLSSDKLNNSLASAKGIYNLTPNYGSSDDYTLTVNTKDDLVLTGYNLYRADTVGPIAFVSVDDPRTYRDEIVAVGVEYTYWATAVYTLGESGPSNTDTAIPYILDGFYYEPFDLNFTMTGWTVDPTIPNNWGWSPGYAMLNWSPSVTNYDMSLISPTIVLPADPINIYDIVVSMYIDDYTPDTGEIMEIWIIHDGVETMIFEWDLDIYDDWGVSGGQDWVYTDTEQFAGETVQLKFRSHGGDTYNFNYWYVYDIMWYFIQMPPEYGSLHGTVTDGYGVPIEGAEITVAGDLHPQGRYVVTTNDSGYYEIDPIIAQFYNFTCEADGYTTFIDTFTIHPNEIYVKDVILGIPTIDIIPTSLNVFLMPYTQLSSWLTISNNGNGALGWEVIVEPQDVDFTTNTYNGIIGPSSYSESDQNQTVPYNPLTKDMWDVLFAYDVDTPSGGIGIVGAEFGNGYFLVSEWGWNTRNVFKFDVSGNYISSWVPTWIPGTQGLRDMAFDGDYFYGSNATNTIYSFDEDGNLQGTINSPVAVRSIAYDEQYDAFWVNNWSEDLKLVDRSGNVLNTIYGPPSMYGSAYDNVSDGGPYLWIFTGTSTGGGCQVEQYNLNTLTLTGVSHSVSGDFPGTIAGGLFASGDIVAGTWVLGGLTQGTPDILFGYELGDNYIPPIIIPVTSGIVLPEESYDFEIIFNSTLLPVGTIFNFNLHFISTPNVGEPIIPVTMAVIQSPTGDIDGIVTETGTGTPLEGVIVIAEPAKYTTATDGSGYYLFDNIPTGIYDLTFELSSHNEGTVTGVEVFEDQTTTINYQMTAPNLTFNPDNLLFNINELGAVDTDTLAVSNIGTGPVDFMIDIGYVKKYRQSILCVDRDGSYDGDYTDDWPYFQAALDAAGYVYTYYEVADLTQDGPDLVTMQQYDVIIWFSGEAWGNFGHDCMTDNDELNLASYLDDGGLLFLSSQDYLWASYPSAGNFTPGQFPYDYLGMRTVSQDKWVIETPATCTVEGVTGSLAWGYIFTVQDIYTTDRDGLFIDEVTNHVGQDIFNVTSPAPQGICGIEYGTNLFRTVFTTASFAAITDPIVQSNLIDDIIIYMQLFPWIPPIIPTSGTIAPSTTLEILVTVDTEGLDWGDYYANIIFNTSNPDIGQTIIPVHLDLHPESANETPVSVTMLNNNFPNPFTNSTTISFSLKEKSNVKLTVYNMKGQLVSTLINKEMNPSANHEIIWNGKNGNSMLANGIYFYKLETKDKSFVKRMIILK